MIYFDNSATTKPCEGAVSAVNRGLCDTFGNPSSGHPEGIKAAGELRAARGTLASVLHTDSKSIYFTSGGTASDNIAVFGGAKSGVGRHVVTSAIEHDAVLGCFKALDMLGFSVTYVKPREDGNIHIEDISAALRENTSLVSIMTVNNETGAISPIDKIKIEMLKICPRALFHTAAVQAFGKHDLLPEKWGVDMLSLSGHKMHAPKGIGALYIRSGVSLNPVVYGGGQEGGVFSGTENLPAIMGLAAACDEIDLKCETVREINSYLREELIKIPNAVINSPKDASPYVLNVSFPNIPSEVILNALAGEGICASAGSACAANKSGESHVLKAMGKSPKSAIRLSFSRYNTMDEAKTAAEYLKKVIPMLSGVVR